MHVFAEQWQGFAFPQQFFGMLVQREGIEYSG
jgi:hypothetical protein